MLSPLRLARSSFLRISACRDTAKFHSSNLTDIRKMVTCVAPVKEKYERLPTFAVPEHYELKIVPDMRS
ncbi:hypothetical protein ANCDUO_06572 [Ancylostoma duodenale]|uniref:Uncharacterized protein n=1 Tax=Ancylostoma duodenale TaxID=51022 RepID=A0A0C2H160_9BILA|nr:hypothetical protein ANCDUO_06572 [Ancylostoma duodenale]